MLIRYLLLTSVLMILSACGCAPGQPSGGDVAKAGNGDSRQAVDVVGTWALVMDDPELALEVLPDGTALGHRTIFLADKTGRIDMGGEDSPAFSWSYGADGVLKQIFTLASGDTNAVSYRVEDLGDDRIRLVNVEYPTQDASTYLRR